MGPSNTLLDALDLCRCQILPASFCPQTVGEPIASKESLSAALVLVVAGIVFGADLVS